MTKKHPFRYISLGILTAALASCVPLSREKSPDVSFRVEEKQHAENNAQNDTGKKGEGDDQKKSENKKTKTQDEKKKEEPKENTDQNNSVTSEDKNALAEELITVSRPDTDTNEIVGKENQKVKDLFDQNASAVKKALSRQNTPGTRVSGEVFALFPDLNILQYQIRRTDAGYQNPITISSEEKTALGETFKPAFTTFWTKIKHASFEMDKKVARPKDLTAAVNGDVRYIAINYLATTGNKNYIGDLSVGSDGSVMSLMVDVDAPDQLIGPAGLYHTDPAVFNDIEAALLH